MRKSYLSVNNGEWRTRRGQPRGHARERMAIFAAVPVPPAAPACRACDRPPRLCFPPQNTHHLPLPRVVLPARPTPTLYIPAYATHRGTWDAAARQHLARCSISVAHHRGDAWQVTRVRRGRFPTTCTALHLLRAFTMHTLRALRTSPTCLHLALPRLGAQRWLRNALPPVFFAARRDLGLALSVLSQTLRRVALSQADERRGSVSRKIFSWLSHEHII